jgi:hypothetical protein
LNSGWAKLVLNDEEQGYFLAKVVQNLDLQGFYESGAMDVYFNCMPFMYGELVSFTADIASSGGITVKNPGNRGIDYKSPYGTSFTVLVTGNCEYIRLWRSYDSHQNPVEEMIFDTSPRQNLQTLDPAWIRNVQFDMVKLRVDIAGVDNKIINGFPYVTKMSGPFLTLNPTACYIGLEVHGNAQLRILFSPLYY